MAKRPKWGWRRYAIGASVVVAVALAAVGVQTGALTKWDEVLTHEQEVWLHALEWCESRGVTTAVNPKDLDGTPSYYSFQFKPSTFKQFGIKYGLLAREISEADLHAKLDDYILQKRIVSTMINDRSVWWAREFPACVRAIGRPPLKK